MKKKTLAKVISHECLQPGIYDMWLATELAEEAHPGQFIGVYTSDASKILPRPISICQINKGKDGAALRLVYRVSREGAGTDNISKYKAGDEVYILGILGNGYDLEKMADKDVVIMGGGIGVPPMLELTRSLVEAKKAGTVAYKSISVVLGYRDSNMFLKDDFAALEGDDVKLYIATEDGSVGTRGNVINACAEQNITGDVVCACGPMPMLRAIVGWSKEHNMKAYISLEERMACGVGACLGCITKTKEIDDHSHVYNARICTDGPVFDADDLEL